MNICGYCDIFVKKYGILVAMAAIFSKLKFCPTFYMFFIL
jgi:hypothetical protein